MIIDVEHLQFTYYGAGHPAVRGLDFQIEQGEIFGFLGPSGAGKTTTQNILIGLLEGYQGRVSVLGRELNAWDASLYEKIGVSFEFPNHYLKLTALENLSYFRALYDHPTEAPETLLEWVGLEQDGRTPVGEFSKGMKNRLNVARALLHRPELLFMDEPTAGLDPVNARSIKDLILTQKRAGRTVFLTTHNMAVAEELCDRLAFIVDGEIKLIDEPGRLKIRYGEPLVRVEYQNETERAVRQFPLPGLADDPVFLELLRSQSIQTIHTMEASLEDIFIRVTGRELA
jgi:fluoroquinolone transport system ATP-binding protein